jgi:hypothetical protein
MYRRLLWRPAAALAVLAAVPATGFGQQPAGKAPPRLDPSKTARIERPVEALVKAASAPAPAPVTPADPDNPKVKPGDVNWHPNFADACKASEKTGKPVLLFHMMGRLDDRFC